MPFEVTILGSSSATPTVDRHPSAQLLNIRDTHVLIDCGEATQNQMLHYRISHSRIAAIFISHLHGDHYLGLNGLLATINFQGRDKPLDIFAPAPLENMILDHFKYSGTHLKFPLRFHPTQNENREKIWDSDKFEVYSIPLIHRIPTTGFVFKEKVGLRHINVEACQNLDVPYAHYPELQEGRDYIDENGTVHLNSALTLPPSEVKSYAYVSDTRYFEELAKEIENVNMLYHEATFLNELKDRADETLHTTALDAGRMAGLAQVKKLLIGHYSARYRDLTPLLEEAKTLFENSHLAIEGSRYSVD
ncbi:MAG: ribonuclease Z [Bacteroidetes bacterium]|nr:ribonuclease Z [Bacteroidota bacterium]